jgi:hypothetical protein
VKDVTAWEYRYNAPPANEDKGVRLLSSIHGEAIRIPMEIIAVSGSIINLYAIWRVGRCAPGALPSGGWDKCL